MNNDFFTSHSIELGPWSNSKMGTLETCPLKFELQYVEKVKKEDIPETLQVVVDDSALRYGNSVHKVSELVSTGHEISKAISDTSKEHNLTVIEKKQLKAARKNVLSFEERLAKFKETYSIKNDLTEQSLALDKNLEETKYFSKNAVLRGKVDRLLITEDNSTAIIVDLKTGKKATLDYSKDQLDFYTTLVFGAFPEVKLIRSSLYFTRLGKMLWAPPVKREDYPMNSTNSIVSKINEISDAYASTEEAAINIQSLCKWCIYKEICKLERKSRKKNSGS